MQETDLMSIITPVYNAANYIEQTLLMVEQQTYEDWELILVDDASTDRSMDIVRRFLAEKCDERVRLIYRTGNGGAAAARNAGIDESRGRYIAFLDADDVWKPDKLEKELAFMREKGCYFAFTAYEFGNRDGSGNGRIVRVPDKLTYKKALSRTVVFTSTVMIDTRKVPLNLIHMPDVPSEDTATWWQLMRSGYTACGLNEVLTVYRRPDRSLSSNKMSAIKRIWNLYRNVEKLPVPYSIRCFCGWAVRAVVRRI